MPLAALWFGTDRLGEEAEEYPGGAVLRDNAGNILRVTLGPGDVDCRPFYEADPDDWIAKAVVAVEDGTFWTHCGVRPLSVIRAACQNVFYRRRISGASTITMQAVRLVKPHPKTLWWKAKEAVAAIKTERVKDKRWILSQYLNRAPYGSNLVGIEAAAQGWFGKSAKDLGLGEAAMLAGLVQAPSRFRPDRHYDRALQRRDYVLERMVALGTITREQMDAARSVRPVVTRSRRPFKTPHFCDWTLRRLNSSRPGGRFSGDVRTALDADVQRTAESAVARAAAAGGCSSAAVVVRVEDGEVVALACSGDYREPVSGQVNTAASARPAGSTLKPFLAALAIDRGLVTPETLIADAPVSYKGYRPANFDSKYRGMVSLRDSLVLSLNIPFVRLLRRVGTDEFGECLRGLGFGHVGDEGEYGLGMAIGNVEVTLVELCLAYRRLAAGGAGSFSPGAAYLVSEMLSGGERSAAAFGHVADVPLPRFAWKTGTSSAYRDAWTVVWNPEWVVGVWCGHKRGVFGDKTIVGAKAAAPFAWAIARALSPSAPGPWFDAPPDAARPPVAALEASREALSLLKPEDGAVFRFVHGMKQQKIVCRAVGCAEGERLWWFMDGIPAWNGPAESPVQMEMVPGDHVISCATADGTAASSHISVLSDGQ